PPRGAAAGERLRPGRDPGPAVGRAVGRGRAGEAPRRLRAAVRRAGPGTAARARHRPAQPPADAARCAQLVADLVPLRPGQPARDGPALGRAAARSTSARMSMDIRPKVLVTKIGFDGHDRGSRVVAAYLRDAGMEVIYTPPWQEIGAVVKLALEEDVDVIGVSSLATDHLIVPKLMDALRAAGPADVIGVGCGVGPRRDQQVVVPSGG